jgi:hypothetical protein
MGREDEIRIIAYLIWEEEGCCDGHDCEHWLKAEVIWEEKQKNGAASTDTKAKSKQNTNKGKKNKAAKKRQ